MRWYAVLYDQGAYKREDTGTCWWWLRSPGHAAGKAASVDTDGRVFSDGDYVYFDENTVRPALWINLNP